MPQTPDGETPSPMPYARVFIGVAAVAVVVGALTDQHGIMIAALVGMLLTWFAIDADD